MMKTLRVQREDGRIAAMLRRIPADWLIAAALLIAVVILWLPFGFNIGYVGDGWFFYLNSRYGIAWANADRPFLPLAYVIGYALAPGRFAGFNLMMVLLLCARSGLTYAILRRLRSGRALAFAVAILVAMFPADSGVFYMGALNVYFAWVAYLLAFYLLLTYWRQPRLITLVLMWVALIVNVGTYEAAYPLIVLSPLALLILKRRSLREWIAIAIRWYVFPVLNLVRLAAIYLIMPSILHYESGLLQSSLSPASVLESLALIYERHFATSWVEYGIEPSYAVIALAVGALTCGLCWWLARHDRPRPLRLTRWFVWAGIGIVALAVAMILPTSLSTDPVRTYFVSSIGAALAAVALLWLLLRRPLPFALVVGLIAGLGCAQLLAQHATYVESSDRQQALIVQLTAQVPSIAPNSALLIMDETPDQELNRIYGNRWHFQNPFMVAYDDPSLAVALCYPDDSAADPDAYCAFGDQYVEARISPLIVWQRPYDHVILVRYTASHQFVLASSLAPYGSSSSYAPAALIAFDSPPPAVVRDQFTSPGQ